MSRKTTLAERLSRRSQPAPNGCIEFTGCIATTGYGHIRTPDRVTIGAHRAAWIIANGPIPDGLWVLHRCDNRKCVNVEHLFLGTALDNNRDCEAKGRRTVKTKFTDEQIAGMRAMRAAGVMVRVIAARYKGHPVYVGQILNGKARVTA